MDIARTSNATTHWRNARHLTLAIVCAAGLGGCTTAEWLSFLNIEPAGQSEESTAQATTVDADSTTARHETALLEEPNEAAADRVAAISPAAGGGHSATRPPIEDAPVRHNSANRNDLTQKSLASMFLSFLMP